MAQAFAKNEWAALTKEHRLALLQALVDLISPCPEEWAGKTLEELVRIGDYNHLPEDLRSVLLAAFEEGVGFTAEAHLRRCAREVWAQFRPNARRQFLEQIYVALPFVPDDWGDLSIGELAQVPNYGDLPLGVLRTLVRYFIVGRGFSTEIYQARCLAADRRAMRQTG